MADLERVNISDTLLIPVKVLRADTAYDGAPVKVAFETIEFWLDRDTVAAAEHIPAPRIFKRGDWVSWRAHGAVQMVVADDVDDERVWVTSDNPAQNILWRKQDCEPTEAPE